MANIYQKPTRSEAVRKQMHGKMRSFLDAYAILGNITKACKAAKLCHKTYRDYKNREDNVLEWRGREIAFPEAVNDALDEAIDSFESEALKRATVGTQELVLHQGKVVKVDQLDAHGEPTGKKVVLTKSKYSDLLLIFMLKGFRPKKYADHRTVEQTGEITHNHKDIRDLPPEKQQKRLSEYFKTYNRMKGICDN